MPTPDLMSIAANLYRLRIPGGQAHALNSYIWVGADGVTLIDAGWPDSAELIAAAIESVGKHRSDVIRLVLTHFHDDHAGSAAEIAEWRPGMVVAAGKADSDVIRGRVTGEMPTLTEAERAIHPGFERPPMAPPCRVDLELTGGEVLPVGRAGARVISTPGHTPGSIALHLIDEDVVLVGDSVAEFEGEVILGVFNSDRGSLRRSAATLASTGATIAGFGHGDVVGAEAAQRIAAASDPFA
ncbi:MBL fold metallo-hydrolase [Microbacterium sp. CFH 90308]|uniref:MBL fold metallo-hydrolase n=1 Tax=Microbacterium salsuginis TaxID=2722803 RepID=A0ABX1K9R5_9MICO|nr:MBL fold metallo-hydrolase [Microbacterium sp. CFH 90308]